MQTPVNVKAPTLSNTRFHLGFTQSWLQSDWVWPQDLILFPNMFG